MSLNHYNLTLTGAVQNLLTAVLAGATRQLNADLDRPFRSLWFQAGGGNSGIIYCGSTTVVSSTDYGWRIEIPVTSIPSAPYIIGEYENGPLKLSDYYVKGTLNDVLHITAWPY